MTEPLDQKALAMARRSIGLTGKAGRLGQMLRHYDSRQILLRGFNVLVRKLQPGKLVGQVRSDGGALKDNEKVKTLADSIVQFQSGHPSHSQCDIGAGRYVMLNDSISMSDGFDQGLLSQKSHLWRFQFHYHEFLLTQAANRNWGDINSFLDKWLTTYLSLIHI